MVDENCFDEFFFHLTGFKCNSDLIVRSNNEKLSVNGDFYFLTSFKFWKTILGDKLHCHENCTDILQHYAHTRNVNTEEAKTTETNEAVVRSLVSSTYALNFSIEKFSLRKERVCLFLNRRFIMENTIMLVLERGQLYGRSDEFMKESVQIAFKPDETSEMTNLRLYMIQRFCKNILKLQKYTEADKNNTRTILLTSKSLDEKYVKNEKCDMYVCGVVKNCQTNTKEKTLSCLEYIHDKIEALVKQNEERRSHLGTPVTDEESRFRGLAVQITNFELLSVKPSHPVFLNFHADTDKSYTNTKGYITILYNYFRIISIFIKLDEGVESGKYSSLENVRNTDFSVLDDEDEWELVYNFLLQYPDVIKKCVMFEPSLKLNPHILCMFLSRLSRKFSSYYRRTKILTGGAKHLHMQLSARFHLLTALRIVLENSFEAFHIKNVEKFLCRNPIDFALLQQED